MNRTATINAVADFSADYTGATDATVAIQNAINQAQTVAASGLPASGSNPAVAATGGAAVYLPAGTYKVSSTLSVTGNSIAIYGDGVSSTIIQWTSTDPTKHALTVSGSQDSVRDLSLVAVGLTSVPQSTLNTYAADNMSGYAAGAAVYYSGPSGNLRLRDLVVYGFMTGIQLNSQNASQVWITDVDLANNAIYGILVTDLGGNAFFQRLEVSCPVSTYYAQAVGVRINRGDGYQISDSIIFQCGKAALALQPIASTPALPSPENGSALTNVFLSNTQFDFAYGPFGGASDSAPTYGSSVVIDGSLFNSSTVSPVSYVYFTNCSGTSAGLNGFFLRNCSRVDLTGCKAFTNAGHGLRLDSPSSHVRIVGGQYFSNNNQNGQNTPFSHDGIFFGAGVTDFSVAHATCSFTTGDSQRFGINVSSTTSDRYSISGCDVLGYSGTAINDLGTGSHKEVFQNLGYD